MKRLYHRLLIRIASSTQKELARQVRYLKVENEILRSKLPRRVPLSEKEKHRLVRFGAKFGKVLNELATIAQTARCSIGQAFGQGVTVARKFWVFDLERRRNLGRLGPY